MKLCMRREALGAVAFDAGAAWAHWALEQPARPDLTWLERCARLQARAVSAASPTPFRLTTHSAEPCNPAVIIVVHLHPSAR